MNVYGKQGDLMHAVDCGTMDRYRVRLLRLSVRPARNPAGCTVPSDQARIQAKRAAERAKAEAEKKKRFREASCRVLQRLKSPQRTGKEENENGL